MRVEVLKATTQLALVAVVVAVIVLIIIHRKEGGVTAAAAKEAVLLGRRQLLGLGRGLGLLLGDCHFVAAWLCHFALVLGGVQQACDEGRLVARRGGAGRIA